jgi:hypothetical protein
LVVAVKRDGQWHVIGTVSQGLTPPMQAELTASAAGLQRDQPFVPCTYTAIWLEPVLRCRIEAEPVPGKDEFRNLKVLELL